jgi:uncharacterized protein (DUF362 family)
LVKVIVRDVGDVHKEVDYIFAQLAPDLSDKRVLVKPNIMMPLPGDSGKVTHPEVVRAVVRACRARGARVMLGDNPAGSEGNSRITAQRCGILDAAEGAFINLSAKVVPVPARSKYVDTFYIAQPVLEADYVINLPIFKTHVAFNLTGTIKNAAYGYLAGGTRARLHLAAMGRRRFAELLVDVYSKRVPDLHILDALTISEGNGPLLGPVRPFGQLLASTDGVALEAVMARMAGLDPQEQHTAVEAARRGLGTWAAEEIEVEGNLRTVPDFQRPTGLSTPPEEQRRLLEELGSLLPVLVEEKCNRCADCQRDCPTQAISMQPLPVIETGKCISCFSCVELCPPEALLIPWEDQQAKLDRVFS